MKYDAVIFDLDGVICHTDQYHYQAWKAIADQYGIYFDEAINNRLRGVSRMESLNIILEAQPERFCVEEKEALCAKKNKIYQELLQGLSPNDVEAAVDKTLSTLRQKGVKLAIASSSKNARFILDKLDLMHRFDVVVDGNQITKSKPDPQVFVLAAQTLGVQTKKCLVVEDSVAGVVAAKAGGMDCAGLLEAGQDKRCDHSLNSLDEILNFLQ
ncbi:MAG: beta-phosphoglucomutase [Clostridiales bacterium]|nr:beta-phosphoglucomutase [Clostridiales bacterium]